jgi:hypothetical protein
MRVISVDPADQTIREDNPVPKHYADWPVVVPSLKLQEICACTFLYVRADGRFGCGLVTGSTVSRQMRTYYDVGFVTGIRTVQRSFRSTTFSLAKVSSIVCWANARTT